MALARTPRIPPDRRPAFLLSSCHPATGGSGNLAFRWRSLRRDSGCTYLKFRWRTIHHAPPFLDQELAADGSVVYRAAAAAGLSIIMIGAVVVATQRMSAIVAVR